jgi:predicted HicB family RNase H-like nuclease
MPKAKKIGRPKLPKGHAKGKILPVRVNPEDMKAFTRAAKASEHKTLSGWIRHTLKAATQQQASKEVTK